MNGYKKFLDINFEKIYIKFFNIYFTNKLEKQITEKKINKIFLFISQIVIEEKRK
jgi:hypothetical protein